MDDDFETPASPFPPGDAGLDPQGASLRSSARGALQGGFPGHGRAAHPGPGDSPSPGPGCASSSPSGPALASGPGGARGEAPDCGPPGASPDDPAGGAADDAPVPLAGRKGLTGREAMDAVQAAITARNRAKRNWRGQPKMSRRKDPRGGAGMNRRYPDGNPPGGAA